MKALRNLTLNQKLGGVAFVFGVLALLGGPRHGSVATVDARELSVIVEKEVDHVAAAELAGWIIEGRADYRLIDLRTETAYAAYHIPTAENVPITELLDYGLLRNEKIILYSDGGIHSAQAWFLMKTHGYKGVYMLLGGLNGWEDEVLFPALSEGASPQEAARFEQRRRVSAFFGGSPRTGAEAASAERPEIVAPKIETPAVPSAPVQPPRRREGC